MMERGGRWRWAGRDGQTMRVPIGHDDSDRDSDVEEIEQMLSRTTTKGEEAKGRKEKRRKTLAHCLIAEWSENDRIRPGCSGLRHFGRGSAYVHTRIGAEHRRSNGSPSRKREMW